MDHLFDRWQSTGQHSGEGTGLGLSIAKEIALRHNIDIQVESRPREGTTFRFVLRNISSSGASTN